MKRILMLVLTAACAIAQNTVTLTAVSPLPVTGLGAGVVGTPGTATACYWVVVNYVGGGIMSAAPTCPANIPGTLNSSNYVLLNWQAAAGTAPTYDVLKTTGPTPPAPGATVGITTGLTSPTYQDQGGSLSPYTLVGVAYPVGSAILQLNNRDFAVPAFEWLGTNIQGSAGVVVPKGAAGTIRLGSRSTPTTIDSTGALYITSGSPAAGAAVGVTTGGIVVSTSASLTLAQVNAGTIILPAVTGQTYKLQHVQMQAVGGSTAGCTLVEVTDTAASPIVGVSFTVAILTSGAIVNEASGSGVTVTTFAPTALTASRGLQIIKTGSACTTATSFNVIVTYTINS
jgi:hypothetical protein